MSIKCVNQHIWDAKAYQDHSTVQFDAAMNVLDNQKFRDNEQVLDVGCGDGKITYIISTKVPQGFVLGVDLSSNMIEQAKKTHLNESTKNIDFKVLDARDLNYSNRFDKVFSFSALQWVCELDVAIQGIYRALKPSGTFSAITPLGISPDLEQTINQVISSLEWSPYFKNFSSGAFMHSPEEIKETLSKQGFTSIEVNIVPHCVYFSTREKLERFVYPWFSYLRVIPEDLKQDFWNQIFERYMGIESVHLDDHVIYRYSYIHFSAKKTDANY